MQAKSDPRAALSYARNVIAALPSTSSRSTALHMIDNAQLHQPYPAASLETAACLWEAIIDMLTLNGKGEESASADEVARRDAVDAARDRMGTAALRLSVIGWTDALDADWRVADDTDNGGGAYDEAFDWSFVPAWLALNVDWTGPNAPTLRQSRRIPRASVRFANLMMEYEDRGNGCESARYVGPRGFYIRATALDGIGLPTPGDFLLCVYGPNDPTGEQSLYDVASDGGDAMNAHTAASRACDVVAALAAFAAATPAPAIDAQPDAGGEDGEAGEPDDNRFRLAIAWAWLVASERDRDTSLAPVDRDEARGHAAALDAMLRQRGAGAFDSAAEYLTDLISIAIDG